MAILVECSQCGVRREVPDTLAGRKGKCSCGAIIQIPAMASARPFPAPRPVPVAAAKASAPDPDSLPFRDEQEAAEPVENYELNEDELEVVADAPPSPPPMMGYVTPPMAKCSVCGGMFAPHLVYASPSGPICGECAARMKGSQSARGRGMAYPRTRTKVTPVAGGNGSGGRMLVGALMCGGGILLSVVSYNLAAPGSSYTVFTGLIIWGAIVFIRGLAGSGD